MRIRSIKPEYFKHDGLGSLSPVTRILFIGLWCMADCAGRLEDRPKRIKVEVLPYDDVEIEKPLTELAVAGFIIRYSVGDQSFIEIPSFQRHQRITGKEADTESRFPACQNKKPGKQRGNNGAAKGEHPESLEGRRKGRETEGNGFLQFWSAYPKKKSKESAERAFAKADAPLETLMASLDRFKADPDWIKDAGKFIPYPATWLNQRRWEDELFVPVVAAPRPPVAYDAPPQY